MPELPPWLVSADPAQQTARGFQIGLQAAGQQAQEELAKHKQEFYEQEALKEQQLAANRDARAQAELQLQSAAAARKSEAVLGYQKAIQEGVDPLKAMLQYGPAMGQPATSIAAAQRALSAKMMAPATPELVDLGGGVKGVRMGNTFHVLPQRPTDATPGPVKGFPVVDPESGEAIPGFIAVPSPTGKGMTVHITRPPAEISPTAAANMLAKLPELEQTLPGITARLSPVLQGRIQSIIPKQAGGAKEEVLPFPKSKKEAVKGSVYRTKAGPMRWDGDKFVALEPVSAATSTESASSADETD